MANALLIAFPDGKKLRVRIIPSQNVTMTDREYTRHVLSTAAGYGLSVSFWIRQGDAVQAAKLARLAARWAFKLI